MNVKNQVEKVLFSYFSLMERWEANGGRPDVLLLVVVLLFLGILFVLSLMGRISIPIVPQ